MSLNVVQDFLGMQLKQFTHAVCRRVDPDIMFPTNPNDASRIQKGLCVACVHRSDCLELAISFDADGIWGQTTKEERKAIIKDRKRAGIPIKRLDDEIKLVVGRSSKRVGGK